MKCTVFYESWQMECCGTGFSIDDRGKWLVNKIKQPITVGNIGEINYCYEAHSSDWQNIFVLEGKVETIKILYQSYVPSEDNPRLMIPVGGKTVDTEKARGFEKEVDDMEASGYIVTLSEYTIRHANKEEVPFK